jgi:flagellar biosynthesis/type III secretory pathway protein FliH
MVNNQPAGQEPILSIEKEVILRIVEQWGKVPNMPNMEQWLKNYAKQRYEAIERIELGIKDGLPEHEASFQSGYTSGYEIGYERGKRERKTMWVRASEFNFMVNKTYVAQLHNFVGTGSFEIDVFRWDNGDYTLTSGFDQLLILDESQRK